MTGAQVETRPMGTAYLGDLAVLFASERNTRSCWCAAFCTTRSQFAVGWLNGGNRRRFESLAWSSAVPMGVLAYVSGQPVGWCACGPRSRYVHGGRSALLEHRDPGEDETVWLLPCLFVRASHRGSGVTSSLIRAAVELARGHGAAAVEGWPHTGPERNDANAFLGHRQLFEDNGFHCLAQPTPGRAIMRLAISAR